MNQTTKRFLLALWLLPDSEQKRIVAYLSSWLVTQSIGDHALRSRQDAIEVEEPWTVSAPHPYEGMECPDVFRGRLLFRKLSDQNGVSLKKIDLAYFRVDKTRFLPSAAIRKTAGIAGIPLAWGRYLVPRRDRHLIDLARDDLAEDLQEILASGTSNRRRSLAYFLTWWHSLLALGLYFWRAVRTRAAVSSKIGRS